MRLRPPPLVLYQRTPNFTYPPKGTLLSSNGLISRRAASGPSPPLSSVSGQNAFAMATRRPFGSKVSKNCTSDPYLYAVFKLGRSSTPLHNNRVPPKGGHPGKSRRQSLYSLLISPYQKISIYLSFPQDDSYTPSTLAIRAGTGPSDLQDVRVVTLDKPDGWITFDVSSEPNEDGEGGSYVHHSVHPAPSVYHII